ncbi:MAG: type II secretion system protein GspM [Pseudomonadota bacterium]|nr:type II secretion system protein GspM [Pseudomonadota bacterium]
MYQKIERYIKNLSKREKLVLIAAGAALGVFILLAGIVFPMMEYKDRLAAAVNAKDAQLRRVYELSSQIRAAGAGSKNGRIVQQADFYFSVLQR